MTYLLGRRGLNVTAYDLGDPRQPGLPNIPLTSEVNVIRTPYATDLPFIDASFDAVLSCGVLEHVDEYSETGNELNSLREIARILRPGGLLLIYQLPQFYAWQEAVIRRLRLGYAHPRRYSLQEISQILRHTGYSLRSVRRANLIPKNLTGMPRPLRNIYSWFSMPLIALDGLLCGIPGLRHIAGVLEIVAQITGEISDD
jgi:SAM-dependent methyltransferase